MAPEVAKNDYPSVNPVALEGERVSLREFDLDDAPAAYAWASDPRYFRYMAFEPVASTEAVRLLIGFGFDQLELHRIAAVCDPENVGSRRVMEKAGMQREGRLRQDMLSQGRWRDSLAYSILEDEWRA